MVALMDPDYEVILCSPSESFRWNVHGYPHHLAKWHYHPEYELHLILESSGRMMIGDYIGPFEAGCLILTGPNLPHNWVSDLGTRKRIEERDMLVQFSPDFARSLPGFAELSNVRALLQESLYGVVFRGNAREQGARLLCEIGKATGVHRLTLFLELMDTLSRVKSERRILSHCAPEIGVHTAMSKRLQTAIAHVYDSYTETLRLADVARIVEMEPSTFSRFFKKQTGHTFARFVNQLRVNHACRHLAATDKTITEVCFEAGFNNTANFNRQFFAFCGETPSSYRSKAREIAWQSTGEAVT
jgi:AraC-like DNA-binding protein